MAVGLVAALYDVHGNLPALEAVLAEVEELGPDLVVVGGDVVWGPMPAEVLDRLAALTVPVRWVMGNADRDVLAALGEPVATFAAARITQAHRALIGSFEEHVSIAVEDLGDVLFCHGSPRSDEESITSVTPAERLAPMLDGVEESTVVCGHTHHQFDRLVGRHRVVNAGSIGMPYEGDAAAFWVVLGPDVELRRTAYDVEAALGAMRATGLPDVDELLKESLIEPADPEGVAEYFEQRATGA